MSCYHREKFKAAFRAWLDKGMHPAVAIQAACWEIVGKDILY